ncbi:hypothetical protein RABR111495_24165 [Rahnella bruchi]
MLLLFIIQNIVFSGLPLGFMSKYGKYAYLIHEDSLRSGHYFERNV